MVPSTALALTSNDSRLGRENTSGGIGPYRSHSARLSERSDLSCPYSGGILALRPLPAASMAITDPSSSHVIPSHAQAGREIEMDSE